MKPIVYIFRGAPGSGKDTLVPKFCEFLPKPVALLAHDTFRWSFHLVTREVPEVTDEEHVFAFRNAVVLYEQYLKNGRYNIVLEGLFTWDDASSSQGSVKELIELAT